MVHGSHWTVVSSICSLQKVPDVTYLSGDRQVPCHRWPLAHLSGFARHDWHEPGETQDDLGIEKRYPLVMTKHGHRNS